MQSGWKVIIVGGGFAGVEAARQLAKRLPKQASITLISDKTYFEYYPALYRVVMQASPIEVAVPLGDVLPERVNVVCDKAIIVDPLMKEVVTARTGTYRYDRLILAAGSVLNDFGITGVREHAHTFRGIADAVHLKNTLHTIVTSCPATLSADNCHQVVIVGGGATGIELAGDISTYLQKNAKEKGINPASVKVLLFEAGPRILAAASERASRIAARKLQKLGVEIRTDMRITAVVPEGVMLGEEQIPARLVVWSAGAKPSPLYEHIPGLLFGKGGRVTVDAHLRAEGQQDIFVLGDGAVTPKAGLAQTALHDGVLGAINVARSFTGKTLKKNTVPFVAHAIPIGKHYAILSMPGLTIAGWIPYVIRHFIDFDFFAGWLPLPKMLDLFWDGYKYRKASDEK